MSKFVVEETAAQLLMREKCFVVSDREKTDLLFEGELKASAA
jgi:hypothetical protein